MEKLPPKVQKWMEWATATGPWLSTIPDRFSGTELTKNEWLDNIAIRCSAGLTLEHRLSCKKCGLVGIRHDKVRDKWTHLCGIALTKS
ncbi:hypothetical protein ACHAW6_002899 [Cyclotella cf. meneghiniana]